MTDIKVAAKMAGVEVEAVNGSEKATATVVGMSFSDVKNQKEEIAQKHSLVERVES